ncbi:MAG TPA: hypothetical protein VEI07_20410 [Planctomycetaceae bacterium]|nr:hypothetical protein [Planctomycetaceae bacterium]
MTHIVPSFPTELVEFGGHHTYSVYHCHGDGPYLVIETDPDGLGRVVFSDPVKAVAAGRAHDLAVGERSRIEL